MRKDDLISGDDVKAVEQSAIKARNVRTISGFLIVLAGLVFAFVNVELARMGFVVALVGAGIIEPTHIINLLSKKGNGRGGKE